jgi:hypothetical protein
VLCLAAGISGASAGLVVGALVGLAVSLGVLAYRYPWFRTYGYIPWSLAFLAVGLVLANNAPDERRLIATAAYLSLLEIAIVAAFATLLSSFSSPFLSALLTVGLWIIGRSADSFERFPKKFFTEAGSEAAKVFGKIIPNLQIYVPPRPLLTGEAADVDRLDYLLLATGTAAGWTPRHAGLRRADLPPPRLLVTGAANPTSRRGAVMRRVAWAILLLVAISAAVTARVVWAGEREIAASTDALKGGDADAAIVHARAAAYWYAPGAPHVRVAYERLFALAEEAEKRRLWATALFAYRAVISASASTTWLVTPHAEDAPRGRARRRAARGEDRGAGAERVHRAGRGDRGQAARGTRRQAGADRARARPARWFVRRDDRRARLAARARPRRERQASAGARGARARGGRGRVRPVVRLPVPRLTRRCPFQSPPNERSIGVCDHLSPRASSACSSLPARAKARLAARAPRRRRRSRPPPNRRSS